MEVKQAHLGFSESSLPRDLRYEAALELASPSSLEITHLLRKVLP